MNIIIIEDEEPTAKDLCNTIIRLQTDARILSVLLSVDESILFFRKNREKINLIFSDVQLGDGSCFDIFSQVEVAAPVIFCTAFDEYALHAFKANAIDYILKPFTDATIKGALLKYQMLQDNLVPQNLAELISFFKERKNEKQASLLVNFKQKILPVAIDDICFFCLKNSVTHLTTLGNKTYYINKTLDEIERIVGKSFFRINRQCLINRKAVTDVSNQSRKLEVKLCLPLSEVLVVSKDKTSQFLHWLTFY